MKKLREWAARLKAELFVLGIAIRNPLTPWYAKALIMLIIGYAVSPIDLIPDFIPVIGILDDLILLPIGIYFTMRLIPANVITESRQKATELPPSTKKLAMATTIAIIILWGLTILLLMLRLFN